MCQGKGYETLKPFSMSWSKVVALCAELTCLGKGYEPLKPMVAFSQWFRSNDVDDQSLLSFGKRSQPLV